MKICGIQKLTLLDFPGKTACTLFTGGCNFRCPFCHNAPLVTERNTAGEEIVEEEEVFAYLKKRRGILDGVCITGGEPLLQPGTERFLEQVKALGYLVKLDTNGSFPRKLQQLVSDKLVDYVAMDIKNSPEHYGETAGIENFDLSPIQESIDFLKEGHVDYEFRTTVVREFHTKESMEALAFWIRGDSKYYLQNFKDSGHVIAAGLSGFSKEELGQLLEAVRPWLPRAELRG